MTHHIVVVVVAISFSGFGIGVTLSLQNVFGRISLSSAWENNLKRIGVSSSIGCSVEFSRASDPGFSLGSFFFLLPFQYCYYWFKFFYLFII